MLIFWSSLFIYVFYCYCLSIGKMKDSTRKGMILLGGVLLMFIIVLRPLEVPDTLTYKKMFDTIDINREYVYYGLLRKEYITGVEYGYFTLIEIIKTFISDNYRVSFFIVAIIEIFLFNKFAKSWYGEDIRKKAYFIYFTMPYLGFMYLCVTIRAGIAMTLALNAFAINKKGKRNIFFAAALYLLAFTFHRTIVVFLLLEIIYLFFPKLGKKFYWILWGFNGILSFVNPVGVYNAIFSLLITLESKISILTAYRHYYSNITIGEGAISFRRLYFWGIGFLFLFLWNEKFPKEYKKMLNVYMVGLFVMNATGFMSGSSRIYDYFMISVPILMTEINFQDIVNINRKILWLIQLLYGMAGVVIITRL